MGSSCENSSDVDAVDRVVRCRGIVGDGEERSESWSKDTLPGIGVALT